MRICAIVNVWEDSVELLPYFIDNMSKCVNGIIVVASTKSNYGEGDSVLYLENMCSMPYGDRICNYIETYAYTPVLHHAMHSETHKRNFGLDIARKLGYTHFVTCDTDEMYIPEEFNAAKKLFEDSELQGLVCRCQTYFASPKLTIGLDTTLVPFIHKITPTLKHDFNRSYPFAWDGPAIRIDPTRSFNINSGVKMCDVTLHHYSWCRKDIEKKIRNSTARANLERSTIRQDLALAKEGYFVKFYGKSLVRAQVDFNIPEFNVSDH